MNSVKIVFRLVINYLRKGEKMSNSFKNIVFLLVILLIFFISNHVFASPPYFFGPEHVVSRSVYNGDHYRATGLWNFKNFTGYGYAGTFQTVSGNSYATGSSESGELVYGPFDIPDEPDVFLSFWYLWDTEPALSFDRMTVEASVGNPDGPYTVIVDNPAIRSHHPKNKWACMKWIDLSSFRNQRIYIRFFFDTVDHLYNNYTGWLIDQITIYRNHFASVFKPKCILDISLDERDKTDIIARDYSGNDYHGVISNPGYRGSTASHEVKGYLDFSFDNRVDVIVGSEFDTLCSIAVDFWIYPKGYSGMVASRANQFMIFYDNEGYIRFYVHDGGSWKSGRTSVRLPLNQWSYVSILYNGRDQAVFYINGEYSGFTASLREMASGTGHLFIGDYFLSSAYGLYFKGYIGEFKIADIEDWFTNEVQIKNDAPLPSIYHWGLYRHGGTWLLDGSEASIVEDLFGGSYDINDSNIQNLIDSIGVDTYLTTATHEVWYRLKAIWEWLQTNSIPPGDPRYAAANSILPSGSWPSLHDRADQFAIYGGFTWSGTCGAYAVLFGSLMRLAGINPSMIGSAQLRYANSSTSSGYASHAFNAIHLNGRWIPLDATGISLDFPDYPNVTSMTRSNPTFDYAHPVTFSMPPGGAMEEIPLMHEAFYPEPLEAIRITIPPNGAVIDQDTILVAGQFWGVTYTPPPDYVLINGKKVSVHESSYFITSIPVSFAAGESVITITSPSGSESASVTVYNP